MEHQLLKTEIAFFNKCQQKLISDNTNGGFVVIKGEMILGVWQSRADALQEAIQAFGYTSVLVKNINDNLNHFINYSRPLNFTNAFNNG
jgi:hypothetical protein